MSGLGLGGAERQVVLLSRELERLGHAVGIYTLNRRDARVEELAGSQVDVVLDQKRRKLDLAVLGRLRRHIRAWRPDIVQTLLYDAHIYTRLAAAGAGVPVINSERNDDYQVSLMQRIGYWLTAPLYDGIIANSHAGARFARRLHRLAENQVHVVWNGIDLREIDARLARAGAPARAIFPEAGVKRLCLVGSIKPQKDHLLALRVMRRLADEDPSWRLICIGDRLAGSDERYKAQVLAERERLGLAGLVEFVGHRRDVPELIASSDLLLVTSRHEGFPNVVLEAMACGVAVVSTEYSDVRLILPLAHQVVASRTADELAAAVVRCHGERAAIAAAQRHWVERHASAAASAAALLAIYESYVAVSARRAPRTCPKGAPRAGA